MKNIVILFMVLIMLAACENKSGNDSVETRKPNMTEEASETSENVFETDEPPPPELEYPDNPPPDYFNEEQLRLWNSIAEQATGEIVFYDIDDYEGDGELVMFAVVGNTDGGWGTQILNDNREVENLKGEVWFANSTSAEKIIPYFPGFYIWKIELGLEKFIIYQNILGATNIGHAVIHGVKDNNLILIPTGYMPDINEYGELTALCMYRGGGPGRNIRVEHNYYFYYDEQLREIREYGGVEISMEQFMTFKNAQQVIALLPDEADEIIIFYRANGVINMNFTAPYTENDIEPIPCNCNISMRIENNEIYNIDERQDWESIVYSGSYLVALYPEIATFPDISTLFQ